MTLPLVTVLIPARNEERDIAACLASVVAQDYPLDHIEVIVVDGASTDATADVVKTTLDGAPFRRTLLLTNELGTTPTSLNLGLEYAEGEYLCRVDARSRIPTSYVRRCVETLRDTPEIVVAGGAQVAIARRRDARSIGIARALNNRWMMGLSRYRRDAPSGPTDTVYLGAFRTAHLRAAGGWDVRFATNQDFELNRRLGRDGVVWFDREIPVSYLPRPTLRALFSQYHRFGRWKVRYWRSTGERPRPRQVLAIAAPPVAALGTAVMVLTGRRWVVPAALAALVAAEVLGAPRAHVADDTPVLAHGVAVGALLAVMVGWHSGVVREWMSAAS